MHELRQLIFGGISPVHYLAALFFSSLAILLSMWVGSAKRNVDSRNTPKQYSFRFLFWDNTKRILAGLIAMFLLYRFSSGLIGHALTMEAAVAIGFFISMGTDQVIGWLKQHFDVFRMNRSKIMKHLKQKGIS
jgi:hypothetical protein